VKLDVKERERDTEMRCKIRHQSRQKRGGEATEVGCVFITIGGACFLCSSGEI